MRYEPPAINFHLRESPPREPQELGFTRVRHLKWPKSDKSDFGWGGEHTEQAARGLTPGAQGNEAVSEPAAAMR